MDINGRGMSVEGVKNCVFIFIVSHISRCFSLFVKRRKNTASNELSKLKKPTFLKLLSHLKILC